MDPVLVHAKHMAVFPLPVETLRREALSQARLLPVLCPEEGQPSGEKHCTELTFEWGIDPVLALLAAG